MSSDRSLLLGYGIQRAATLQLESLPIAKDGAETLLNDATF